MQKMVTDRIRPADSKDAFGAKDARAALDIAHGMIEAQLQRQSFAAGDAFPIADCAAFPGLFLAPIVHPFGADQSRLAAYFERLRELESIRPVLGEARPFSRCFHSLSLCWRGFSNVGLAAKWSAAKVIRAALRRARH